MSLNHYTGVEQPKRNGGNSKRASIDNLLSKLKPSEQTKTRLKSRVKSTKQSSYSLFQKLKAFSSQVYVKIKTRIATATVKREPVTPYETVAMQPAELENDLVDKKVLQRYNMNNQGPPKGFVPDESIREQRRERRRQRQLKKAQQNKKNNSSDRLNSAPEAETEKTPVVKEEKVTSVANPLYETEVEKPDKVVQNPLFREDEDDSVPAPSKTLEAIDKPGFRNPLFVDV